MDQDMALKRMIYMVKEFARSRRDDVSRGAETPRLAALMIQKYGRGVADAAALFYTDNSTANLVQNAVDEETTAIDPDWREHDR